MWKPLAYNPIYKELHPCIHRWMKQNIANLPPKNVRYILQQTSKRTEYLAMPHLRRLLSLYLEHYETLSPDKRNKILQILLDSGFTIEQLNKMILEEKRRKEILRMKADAGPFDIFDDEGNLISGKEKKKRRKKTGNKRKRKKKKKEIKRKSKKILKKKKKKAKKNDDDGDEYQGFKAGKSGQLGTGWPHFIGLQLMALIWKLEQTSPDEVFISRAQAYFNIQAEALHQIFNGDKEPQILDVNKYLNLIVWIAQNVITPAQEIRDEDVGKLLLLRGGELIIKKKKKKKNNFREEKKEVTIMMPQRRWTEQDYPKGNPEKNIIRRSTLPDITYVHSQSSIRSFRANETEIPISRPESVKLSFPLNIDEESLFINSAKWYNPFNPEFIYDGPHVKPKNINFVNENDELKWILSGASMKPQPTHPNPVPIFCPELRPIIHSGVPSPMLSENSCWFVMSNLNFYNIENLKNLNTASVQEQLEMICRLIKTMAHIQKMNIDRFLELTAELCESIEFSNNDETISEMEKLIDDKRTIILEKIFIKFFGSKLRDYNKDTPNYMRIICQRGAVLIRHLYDYTALQLWNQQQQKETEIQEEVQEQEVFKDDAADILKWEEWLQHLLKASHVANVWQKWLQNEIEKDQLPDNREILIQEAKDWIYQGETIRLECQQFLDGAKFLNPIYHRSSLYKSQENIDLSDNDDDDWKSEEIEAQ